MLSKDSIQSMLKWLAVFISAKKAWRSLRFYKNTAEDSFCIFQQQQQQQQQICKESLYTNSSLEKNAADF